MKKNTKIGLIAGLIVMLLSSCKDEYESFIEPVVKVHIEKTTVTDLEPVFVENLGQGEYFTFWPGDETHVYSQRKDTSVLNYGLPPNRDGNSFEYYYDRVGEYTMTIISSSYNEFEDKLVSKIDSVIVTVEGSGGNNFLSFEIPKVFKGYTLEGIIDQEAGIITIPVGKTYAAYGLDDAYFINILINKIVPKFETNSAFARVYDENGIEWIGNGSDIQKIKWFDSLTFTPVEHTFTVTRGGNEKEYNVMAMFYPEVKGFSLLGSDLTAYSEDGSEPSKEDVKNMKLSNPDIHPYGGIVFANPSKLVDAVPTFTLSDGAKLYHQGTNDEIISGVTKVDFSTSPVYFDVKRTSNGHSVNATLEVHVVVF